VRVAAGILAAYQRLISPVLPRSCRFAPTCSEYARQAIVEHGVLRGALLASYRLLKCQPFHPGGWDPPPARSGSR
jgi:uncharacterized protein